MPPDGGRLVFSFKNRSPYYNPETDGYRYVQIPCGRCLQCRIQKSKEWATRCILEASLHDSNCFVTLTYSDDFLPSHGSLVKRDLQLFMKRLRKKYGSGIRFFACGEYGSLHSRPHYHLILFGHDFPDKYVWKNSSSRRIKNVLYRSGELEHLWQYGISSVGEVTYESCAYVARYILKKMKTKGDDNFYSQHNIVPEFTLMSRKPGIAREWFEKYKTDVYSHDFIQVSEKIKARPPHYFDKLYDVTNHVELESIKERRKEQIVRRNPTELHATEVILNQRVKRLIRSYEDNDII